LLFKTIQEAIDFCKTAREIKVRTSMCARLRTHEPDLCRERKITTPGEGMAMTSWTEFVLNAAPVEAIFGAKLPTLQGVDLHEIVLHRDGPRVLLRFDLQDFPAHPPKKWSASGLNRVQMRLLASGVKELRITGWQSNVIVDLSIDRDGPLVRLHSNNGVVRFDLCAESVIVEGVSAYREGSLV
jgi:hypothetical protein